MFDFLVEIFSNFFDWMGSLPTLWVYVTLLIIAYGENVVPPIPGDLVIVFGGYLAATGQLSLTLVFILATIGGSLGFMTMFVWGWRLGDALLDPDRFKWLPKDKIVKVSGWLKRWGYGIILANRFLSGARSVISLAAGMAQMKPWNVFLYATFSAAVWTALIAYLGYVVGDNWRIIGSYLQIYGRIMFWLMVSGAVIWYFVRWRKRKETVNLD